ncbi:MAG: methyltransferase domain-containing protein [Bacteroidia bacterium]|nr:methyltransferase domain-containing protein [Bacteroidia bacterium]
MNYFSRLLTRIGFFFRRMYYGLTRDRISNFGTVKSLFSAKSGLEVGGPSSMFRDRGFIPIYHLLKGLDGCNFSNSTIWEGALETGNVYHFYETKKNGLQYILEASDLSPIASSTYDFVISSNCLEHVANPLKAVGEWIRVVKKDGLLLLVLPNKDFCFDHHRPVTAFSHLISDFEKGIQENDLTHLKEILELHDLSMDRHAGSFEQFKERSLKNFENRALHQHVFDLSVLKEIFNYYQLEVLLEHEGRDLILLGKKIN